MISRRDWLIVRCCNGSARSAQLDRVKVPAKSTVQRYATWLPEEEMREVINVLLRKAGAAMADGKQVLDLEEPLDLSKMFLDTTCVKANIHFPVDWVLLRDGVKSLMQSVELIRTHGLRSRMCEPQVFITKINRLSMEDDPYPAQEEWPQRAQAGVARDEGRRDRGARPCPALPHAAR